MKMSADFGGRRGVAAAATVAAAAAVIGLAVPALAAQAPAAPAASRALAAGQVGSRAAVPWGKVGPGWSLATYSANQGAEGIKFKYGPYTLFLVDPRGGRYALFTWPGRSRQAQWSLIDWSGDVSRALFVPTTSLYNPRPQRVFQVQLRTGATTSFLLPANVQVVGYTRPDGLNILAARGADIAPTARGTLMRFSLAGKFQSTLATVTGLGRTAYRPDGKTLAAGSRRGLELISNSGGVIRNLPVPGVKDGCAAIRWWSAGEILASCSVASEPGPRLWLVPASGGKPTALTPARKASSFDAGDFNAWQLSSGLYVDGVGACGTLVIGRQPAHGPEHLVTVPGSASSLIVNATRSRLLAERINGCSPGISLVWFNPATRAVTVAVPVGHNQHGVSSVVPYFVAGKF